MVLRRGEHKVTENVILLSLMGTSIGTGDFF